jgi:hypothetical protein
VWETVFLNVSAATLLEVLASVVAEVTWLAAVLEVAMVGRLVVSATSLILTSDAPVLFWKSNSKSPEVWETVFLNVSAATLVVVVASLDAAVTTFTAASVLVSSIPSGLVPISRAFTEVTMSCKSCA